MFALNAIMCNTVAKHFSYICHRKYKYTIIN